MGQFAKNWCVILLKSKICDNPKYVKI
jgi:hypothetical protein